MFQHVNHRGDQWCRWIKECGGCGRSERSVGFQKDKSDAFVSYDFIFHFFPVGVCRRDGGNCTWDQVIRPEDGCSVCLTGSVAFIIPLQRSHPHSWHLHNTQPASLFSPQPPFLLPRRSLIDQRGCFTVHRLQPSYPCNENRLAKCDSHQRLLPVPNVRRSRAAFPNQCERQRPLRRLLQNSCPTLTSDLSYALKCPFVSLLHRPLRLAQSFKLWPDSLDNACTFLLSFNTLNGTETPDITFNC